MLGGSILEGDPVAERLSNTSTFFGPDGELAATYRKIHLFDVKAPDREYLESKTIAPGDEIVTAKAGGATVGLSVCYDVRFPELYRLLALNGAEILAVPAAFTLQTGKDHWEILLRARAVENQAFVVAPAQWGQKADGRWTYGRSMIVDPWGTILASAPTATAMPWPPSTWTISTGSVRSSRPWRTAGPPSTNGRLDGSSAGEEQPHEHEETDRGGDRRDGGTDDLAFPTNDAGGRRRKHHTLGREEAGVAARDVL